jgi:DNA helicase-2/ATP-dependent DNA helicase PcrA
MDDSDNKVILMTLHSAKGLEFPYVYLCGMEDGLFPGYMSIVSDDPLEIEEERRLCYVGITRAMKKLTLSYSQSRMVHGTTQFNKISRFVKEIPPTLLGGSLPKERFPKSDAGLQSFGSADSFSGSAHSNRQVSSVSRQQNRKFDVSAFAKKGADIQKKALDYGVGDTVRHIKFGTGVVRAVRDAGKDYEVTVEFPKFGIKKMFAGFAKLKKLD